MLKRLGLEDRILQNMNELENKMTNAIDYKQVGEIRKTERERTLQYLKDNL